MVISSREADEQYAIPQSENWGSEAPNRSILNPPLQPVQSPFLNPPNIQFNGEILPTITPFNPVQQQIMNSLQAQIIPSTFPASFDNSLQNQLKAISGQNPSMEAFKPNIQLFNKPLPKTFNSEFFNRQNEVKKMENQENILNKKVSVDKPVNNFAPSFQQTPVYSVPKYHDTPKITLEASTEEELITRGELPAVAFGAFR